MSDFNGDGWPDLVWANLDCKSIAYINKPNHDNWLKVRLPNTASSINARVKIESENGLTQTKQLITSQGLGSDQGRDLIFGFGENNRATKISVSFQNGKTQTIDDPKMGSVISVRAGQ